MSVPALLPLQWTNVLTAVGAVVAVCVLFVVAIGFEFLLAESALSGPREGPSVGPNCAECGAPNPAERDWCHHCNADLPGGA
jgi:hypothetical protein